MFLRVLVVLLTLLVCGACNLSQDSQAPQNPLNSKSVPLSCELSAVNSTIRHTSLERGAAELHLKATRTVDSALIGTTPVSQTPIDSSAPFVAYSNYSPNSTEDVVAVVRSGAESATCSTRINVEAQSGPACTMSYDGANLHVRISDDVEKYEIHFGDSLSVGEDMIDMREFDIPFLFDGMTIDLFNGGVTVDVADPNLTLSMDLNTDLTNRCSLDVP